jgi:diguanylate cyclase (GGDEF)-like protein
MLSIRKHIERLAREDRLRKAVMEMVKAIIATSEEKMLLIDADEQAWFCQGLQALRGRLEQDFSATNIEVVSALLAKSLADHWTKLGAQTRHREEELKRIINLLTEAAVRLDAENTQFYVQLRTAVQNFEDISQIEDITYLRKKLSEQLTQLHETVRRGEGATQSTVTYLRGELEEAHQRIAALSEAAHTDSLTRLPNRLAAEKTIRQRVESGEEFSVAMAVLERLDLINLRYGVTSGDATVQMFAKEFRERVPEGVALFRWGGPAFVGLATHMPAGEFRTKLQAVLNDIAAQSMELQARGSAILRLTTRFAVHPWTAGQTADKVIKLIDVFCLPQIQAPTPAPSQTLPAAG